jgi:hypothetical protein
MSTSPSPAPIPVVHCSFCGKSQHDVRKVIAVDRTPTTTSICNECVELCLDICYESLDETQTPLFILLKEARRKKVSLPAHELFKIIFGPGFDEEPWRNRELNSFIEELAAVVSKRIGLYKADGEIESALLSINVRINLLHESYRKKARGLTQTLRDETQAEIDELERERQVLLAQRLGLPLSGQQLELFPSVERLPAA